MVIYAITKVTWQGWFVFEIMEKFSAVKRSDSRSSAMRGMQSWVEKFICRRFELQHVVDNRDDGFGSKVTQLMYDNESHWAHVCPFVRDSIDYDVFWIEESPLNEEQEEEIEQLIRSQIADFKAASPALDPNTSGAAAFPILWKTFLTFFPQVFHKNRIGQDFPLWDGLHRKLKPEFVRAGLMLGQFYGSCPQEGIHNKEWIGPLVSPYAAFAIRYMAKHDHLFLEEGSAEREIYEKFFAGESLT